MNTWENPVDPKVKKEINDEGFEGNAAVIIGKKAEAEQVRGKIEKEGVAEDLEAYIKMHKEVIVPADWLSERGLTNAKMRENKGLAWMDDIDDGEGYYFIDRRGNLARFKLNFEKITSLKNPNSSEAYDIIEKDLKNLGFKIDIGSDEQWIIEELKKEMERYAKQEGITLKQKNEEGFNF